MARRKSRKMKKSRSPKSINLFGVAEAALIGNAVTQGFFGVGLGDFFLNKDGGPSGSLSTRVNQITAREIISGITGMSGGYGTSGTQTVPLVGGGKVTQNVYAGSAGMGGGLSAAIKTNLAENGGQMLASLVIIPVAFRVGSRLTRKPRALVNKAGKMAGLPVRV
tara:strand:+ start:390 stop:884 length:495 start_codon:yes stop_codon:yes gene_type:complete